MENLSMKEIIKKKTCFNCGFREILIDIGIRCGCDNSPIKWEDIFTKTCPNWKKDTRNFYDRKIFWPTDKDWEAINGTNNFSRS